MKFMQDSRNSRNDATTFKSMVKNIVNATLKNVWAKLVKLKTKRLRNAFLRLLIKRSRDPIGDD